MTASFSATQQEHSPKVFQSVSPEEAGVVTDSPKEAATATALGGRSEWLPLEPLQIQSLPRPGKHAAFEQFHEPWERKTIWGHIATCLFVSSRGTKRSNPSARSREECGVQELHEMPQRDTLKRAVLPGQCQGVSSDGIHSRTSTVLHKKDLC